MKIQLNQITWLFPQKGWLCSYVLQLPHCSSNTIELTLIDTGAYPSSSILSSPLSPWFVFCACFDLHGVFFGPSGQPNMLSLFSSHTAHSACGHISISCVVTPYKLQNFTNFRRAERDKSCKSRENTDVPWSGLLGIWNLGLDRKAEMKLIMRMAFSDTVREISPRHLSNLRSCCHTLCLSFTGCSDLRYLSEGKKGWISNHTPLKRRSKKIMLGMASNSFFAFLVAPSVFVPFSPSSDRPTQGEFLERECDWIDCGDVKVIDLHRICQLGQRGFFQQSIEFKVYL